MVSTIDCRAVCKSGGSINTIYPSEFDCELMLDIEGIPNIQLRYDPSEYDPSLAETIELLAEKGDSEHTIFSGEITDKRSVYSGHTYKWNELEAMSWGKVLLERGIKGNFVDEGSLVIHDIIAPLIADTILLGEDIEYSGKTVRLKLKNEINIKDALRNLCSPEDKQAQLDYDFKVTNDKVFHAFARGSRSGTLNLAGDALSYDYETTTKNILNTQNVYGKWTRIFGSDAEWFENTDNWNTADDLVLESTNKKVGSEAIKAFRDVDENYDEIFLERTLSPSVDVGSGGQFRVKLYHMAMIEAEDAENLILRIIYRFYSDGSYFECAKEYSLSDPEFHSFHEGLVLRNYKAKTEWKNVWINLGPISDENWITSGNPDWVNITKFRIIVDKPRPEYLSEGFPGVKGENHLILDGGSIISRAYGFYKDVDSIGSFNIRKGEDIFNTNLDTNEECTLAASLIVQAYKDPASYAKNLVTSKNFDASLGWEYPFLDEGITDTLNVRGIHHRLKDFDFSTELEITDQWISIPEKIITKLERRIQTVAWKTERKETGGEFEFTSRITPIDGPLLTTSYITDVDVTIPTVNAVSREIDNSGTFRTWIEATIGFLEYAGGYVLSFRRLGDSAWRHLSADQPSSSIDATVRTDDLDADTQFELHVCALTKYGKASDWSDIETITTQTNDVAPPDPSGLTVIGLVGGIYLEWNPVTANDLKQYNVLVNDSPTPGDKTFSTRNNYCYWRTNDYGITKYLWIKSEDTAENQSGTSNVADASATRIDTDDIEDDAVIYSKVFVDGLTSGGSLDLSHIGIGDIDDIADGSTYAKILATQLSTGSLLLSQAKGDLDDIINGTNFSKVLTSQLANGSVVLSEVLGSLDNLQDGVYSKVLTSYVDNGTLKFTSLEGDLDDIENGSVYGRVRQAYLDAGTLKFTLIEGDLDDIVDGTYGKVLSSYLSAGTLKFSLIEGDLDDITDGSSYGKVLTNQLSAGSITLSAVLGDLDDIAEGGTYGKILQTQITAGSIKLSAVIGDLDDVDEGDNYGKVLKTQLTAGSVVLSAVYGDLDDIAEGSSYGKILQTYLTAGTISLTSIEGDLDDVAEGSTYGKVLTTQLTAGSITLSAVVGDLDDIDEGTNYGKVLQTQITAGSITLSAVVGDLDDIADGGTYEKVLKTQITAGSIRLDQVIGDLDDITDGSSYGKVLTTQISAGSILLGQAVGDLDDIADGSSYGKILKTGITAGSITLEKIWEDPSGTWRKLTRLGAGEIYTDHIGVNQIVANQLTADAILFGTNRYGLVLHMPMDTTVYTGEVPDWSGNENDGTNHGASWVDGRFGQASSFNGSSEYISVPHNVSLHPSTITIELWAKPTNVTAGARELLGKTDAYVLRQDEADLKWYVYDGVDYDPSLTATGVFEAGEWVHIVVIATPTQQRMYINGIEADNSPLVHTYAPGGTSALEIGKLWSEYFNGIIDEVRIYNRALNSDEVLSNYRMGALMTNPTVITEKFIKTGAVTAKQIQTNVVAAIVPRSNLITNGGFGQVDYDDSDIPYGWEKIIEAGTPTYALSTSSHRGAYAVLITSTTTDKGCLHLPTAFWIPVEGSRDYIISLYAKGNVTATAGFPIAIVEWYQQNKSTYISASVIADMSITTSWKHFSKIDTAPSNARWAHIRLYNNEPSVNLELYIDSLEFRKLVQSDRVLQLYADKVIFTPTGDTLEVIFADEGGVTKIYGNRIETDGITADQIHADAITTNELKLDTLTVSDPSGTGKLWFRYDKDQLRFRGAGTDVGYIPRIPLEANNVPPENYVANQSFETNQDLDDQPDFWTKTTDSGSPVFGTTTLHQTKGRLAAVIILNAAGEGKFRSSYIPVTAERKYLLRVSYKGSTGRAHDYTVTYMEFFDINKENAVGADTPVAWKTTTTSWQDKEYEVTVPATKYYMRIVLRNHSTASTYESIYYDDIVFSEMRVAAPTAGIVNDVIWNVQESETVAADAAFHTVWTIPNGNLVEDCDYAFISFGFWATETQSYAMRINDTTAGKISGRIIVRGLIHDRMIHCTIVVPWNVKDHNLDIQVYAFDSSCTAYLDGISWYGFTPHYHR